MKKFLAVFLGSTEAMQRWHGLSEKERAEREKKGIDAWHNWAERNAKSVVGEGAPLGKTKRVGPEGISDTRNNLTAFTVVQAASQEEAAKLFLDHPHFAIFPGDSIEIVECLPIPERKS